MVARTQEYSARLAVHSQWCGFSRIFPCLPGDCVWATGICWETKSHVQLKALLNNAKAIGALLCMLLWHQGQAGRFHCQSLDRDMKKVEAHLPEEC